MGNSSRPVLSQSSLAEWSTSSHRLSQFSKNNNAHIEIMIMSIESKIKETPSPSNQEGGGNAPSGFILKLFQMVNGAPDEVISVSKRKTTFSVVNDIG